MSPTETRLSAALSELADAAPHDAALADAVRRRAEGRPIRRRPIRRRARWLVPLAAAGTAAVVAGAVGVGVALRGDEQPSGTAAVGCRPLRSGPLPEWARAGFAAPYDATYAVSESGDLVAVPFVDLRQPQVAGTANKVLWVPRTYPDPGPVQVEGRLDGSDRTTRLTLRDGLGPSYVDVPVAGCWHLTLIWPGGSDRVDLEYAEGR